MTHPPTHPTGTVGRRQGRELSALTLEEMTAVHPGFTEEVFRVFDPAASVESRAVRGGTAASAVQAQLDALAEALELASGEV